MAKTKTAKLDEGELKKLTDERTFKRGKAYFQEGRVSNLLPIAGGFRAGVHGNHKYTVKVQVEGEFNYDCTCPVGQEGGFCKHLVAACLAWGKQPVSTGMDPFVIVRDWLKQQDRDWLAETLLEQTYDDNRLFNKLHLMATQSGGASELRSAIDRATETHGFVEYGEVGGFAAGIDDVLKVLEQTIPKQAKQAAELCLHAMNRVREAIGYVDDSNGELGACMRRIEEIHLAACKAAKPEPRAFARRLLQLELDAEYDEFHNALDTYGAILGTKGIEEYKRVTREEWDKLPARATPPSPGRDPIVRDLNNRRRQRDEVPDSPYRRPLTRIMAGIAKRERDVNALIAVLSKDLSDAYAYMQLVDVCREHKRYDEALDWAQKGAEAFKHDSYRGLDAMLAEELRRAGKHAEAIEIAWRQFADRPSMDAFNELHEYAQPLKDWQHWRDKAVGHLRTTMAKQDTWGAMETRTLLVEIYLLEGNVEMALQEADTGKCRWETLTKLAETCDKDKLEESFKIYTRLVPEILKSTINANSTPNHRYQQAAEFMQRAQRLSKKLNKQAEFKAWHDNIYNQYKLKRNFKKLLDNAKLA